MGYGERQPRLIDATLREGAQAPGVRFGIAESVEIAQALVTLGVDVVECGHPSASEVEQQRVQAVVEACGSVPVLAHARARLDDIEKVHDTGAKWVGIFLGVNMMSSSARVRPTEPFHRMIEKAVRRARSLGLQTRFTVEDGTRTPWTKLASAFSTALDAGADRICLSDTVGLLCPWEIDTLVRRIVETFAGAEVEVHFHDDRGLACANALSALRAGAGWVSSSVNGIGERCGITDTLTLLANLGVLGWRAPPAGHLLQRISRLVQAHARLPVDRWRPVVGANATTHVARLHQRSVRANPHAYAWIDPGVLGRKTSIIPNALPETLDALVNRPKVVSASAPRRYRCGAGDCYLMIDDYAVSDARQSCIVLDIPANEWNEPVLVDARRYDCDSLFVFVGRGPGLSGLSVEVTLGDQTLSVDSPSSVFIPSGLLHSCRIVAGTGLFINYVLSGTPDASLLDEIKLSDPSPDVLHDFVQDRLPGTAVSPDTPLLDVFDSLLFLDLFIHLEGIFGEVVSLDAVSSCQTFNELTRLLDDISTDTTVRYAHNTIQESRRLCAE